MKKNKAIDQKLARFSNNTYHENTSTNYIELLRKFINPTDLVKKTVVFLNENFVSDSIDGFSFGNPNILIAEDHEESKKHIAQVLQQFGVRIAECSVSTCFDLYQFDEYNSMILWLDLSFYESFDDLELLRKMEKHFSGTPLIVLDNITRKQSEREVISKFALVYLKSLDGMDLVLQSIRIAFRFRKLLTENGMLKQPLSFPHSIFGLTGQSSVSRELRDAIEKASMLETPVVLQGEFGTKKTLLLREFILQVLAQDFRTISSSWRPSRPNVFQCFFSGVLQIIIRFFQTVCMENLNCPIKERFSSTKSIYFNFLSKSNLLSF